MDALRRQFPNLPDAQFLILKKYLVDEFFLAEEDLAQYPTENILPLVTSLRDPKIQYYLDQIALERNQPVQILDAVAFLDLLGPEIRDLLDAGMLCTAQLLTATEQSIKALHNKDRKELIQQKLTSPTSQLLNFSNCRL